jgi:hypothetical protein
VVRLLVIALAGVLLLPAAAPAADPYFGFSDNSVARGELSPEQDAALLARAGATSARISIEWDFVQRTPGPLQLGMYDATYRALLDQGIRPLILVMGAPRWAWPRWSLCFQPTCHFPPDRSHDDDWAKLLAAVALRYPQAAGIEVWNEPNLRTFFGTGPDPGRYAELLRIAYDAVKGVRPYMPVLGASLAPDRSEDETPTHWGMRPFLRAMYDDGARGAMDGLSLHPYPTGWLRGSTYEAIDQVLAVRDEEGDDAPLWLTEVGLSTSAGGSPYQQAVVLADLVPRLLRRPEVKGVYVHTLLDPQAIARTDREAGYGIVQAPGVPKPALCALASAVGAGAGCEPVQPPAAARAAWDAQDRLQSAVERALAYHRATGTYAGLDAGDVGAVDVDTFPGGAGARLCNAGAGRTFCIAIMPHAEFRFRTSAAATGEPGEPTW